MNSIDKMIKDLDETNNTLNCILTNSGGTFGSGAIPLENISGAIDKFQEETDARKKDINDLKYSLVVTRQDLLDIITKNHEQFTKEIDEIKKALVSHMVITLFLTVGFIYCIINL
jgi:hypothetical protein